MSIENVDVVRKSLEAFRNRDSTHVRELFHEDGEFKSALVGGIEGGAFRGHDGIERYFSTLDDAFDDWHTEDERYLEAQDGRIVCTYRIVGRGKGSGVPIDQAVGIVFTLSEGKVIRGQGYLDPKEALTAAGIADRQKERA